MRAKRVPIPPEMRQAVLERDNYTCRYCGDRDGPFWMDHVYPFSKGGETTAANLVTACKKCNIKKGSKVGRWPNSNAIPDPDVIIIHKRAPYPFGGVALILSGLTVSISYPAFAYWVPGFGETSIVGTGTGIMAIGIIVALLEMRYGKRKSF